jgi:mono/diheme cytochrome c family protein
MLVGQQLAPPRRCFASVLFAAVVGVLSIRIAAQQPKMADGEYSDAQAARGEELYGKYCRSCHGAQLAGTEFAPGITGAEFKARWQARSASELFDVVHTTMPLNSPGGLSALQGADLTAFILKKAGFAAGRSDFAPAAVSTSAARSADGSNAAGWYTEEQASRGKALFYRHCATCHTTGDPAMEKTAAQPERGWRMSDRAIMRGLAIRYYPTVYHLYERIRDFMPGWDIDAATPSEKVDIVAYLLKANKFPSGPAELPLNVPAMKKMPIATVTPYVVEEGFEPLAVGTSTPGLKYVFGFSCAPQPAGCGRTDTAGVITVQNGVITAEGRYHGMIYTEKKYRDFDLRFEYRWIPPADMDLDDEFPSVSSGYMLFVDEPWVWPKSIEIEGNEVHLMAAYPVGGQAKSTYDEKTVNLYRKAGGKWNAVRIVSNGGEVKVYLNGALTTHITEHSFPPGHIGFQYQGGKIEWRRIRIKG